jgi:hypothetical protein
LIVARSFDAAPALILAVGVFNLLGMKRALFHVVLLCAALAGLMNAGGAVAQVYHTPSGSMVVPPPPRLAPPTITVPQVPQMASPPTFELGNTSPSLIEQNPQPEQNLKPRSKRKSFSNRVTRCLQEGAALGLGPSERSAYSRACAQQ